MLTPRIRAALVVLAASAGLSACTSFGPYGGIGAGIGSPYGYGQYGYDPYDPYYSGYGYGSPYGYAGYGSQYGYGNQYGYLPYGWYNGYYYPGTGYYVYDPDRNRRQITPEEQAYWNDRISRHSFFGKKRTGTSGTTTTAASKENWSVFRRPQGTTATSSTGSTGIAGSADIQQRRSVFRQRAIEQQQAQRQLRSEQQQARSDRQQARSERIEARQQSNNEQREARRVRRGTSED